MRDLGLDAGRSVSIGNAPVSMAAGAQGIVQLLTQWPDLQAVVCVSDHAAFGALSECQRRGWSVPDRIAIAGFGGFEVSETCHPQLSTVVVDSYGIGRATGDLLLRAIPKHRLSEAFPNETIIIPYRVELRGST
jgi:LacI family gluconate utilization system Gnt-I transcriptional repressor